MPRNLGDAFISIAPDTDGFAAKLRAKLKSALAGIKGEIPVTADTSALARQIAAALAEIARAKGSIPISADTGALARDIAAALAALSKAKGSIPISADTGAALAKIAALEAEIKAMQRTAGTIGFDVDKSKLASSIADIRTALRRSGVADFADINIEPSKILTQLRLMKIMLERVGISDVLDVNLNTNQLRAQTDTLKKLLAGVQDQAINVPLNADAGSLDTKIGAVKAQLEGLEADSTDLKIRADTKEFDAKIAAATAELAKLRAQSDTLTLQADDKAAVAKIAALNLQIAKLKDSLGTMTFSVEITAAEAKIAALQAMVDKLQGSAEAVKFGAQMDALTAAIAAKQAQIALLKQQAADIVLKADTARLNAQLAALAAKMAVVTHPQAVTLNGNISPGFLAKITALQALIAKPQVITIGGTISAALVGTMAAIRGLLFGGGGGGGGAGGGGGGGRGGGGGLIGGFGLWGTAMGRAVGPGLALHAALDGMLEATIAVATAAAAAAIGIAAMAPAAQDVYTHLKAVDTVNESLGNQIPSLSRQFDQLAHSMGPQVIEAYGGALTIVRNNTGALGSTAHTVVNIFDTWIAKLALWSKSQNGLGTILHTGVGFLNQFGTAVGHLLDALNNLLKDDPGTAHVLLDLIEGATQLLDWFSRLPKPIVETALALHSVYLYGKIAAALMVGMGGPAGKVGAAFKAMGFAGQVALAAIALSALEMGRAWDSSSAKVGGDIANMEAALTAMSASQAFVALPLLIGRLNTELRTDSTSQILKGWTGLNDIWQRADDKLKVVGGDLKGVFTGSILHEAESFGNVFKDLFTSNAGQKEAAAQLQTDIANINGEINKFLGASRNMDATIGNLSKQGFTFGQSLALMDVAGVKWNDTAAVMGQKVQDLITGYKAMSVQGSLLNNAVNAISFSTGLQSSKVSDLNSAWDTFIGTVTGGESSLATFGTNVEGMYLAAKNGGNSLSISNGKVTSSYSSLAKAATGTKGTFTGLNTTSLSLLQTFNQSVTNANSYLDSLTTMAAASGLGAKGTTMLASATKDMVALLLPAAKNSKALTAELYALAQRGGYTGADSFKQLSKWVGNTKSPMQDLSNITGKFTIASAGLTKDVQNLSVVLGQTLNTAMSQAIFLASGGQKNFTDFAKAVLTSKGNIDRMQPSADKLIKQILAMTKNVPDAKNEFISFATAGLGLTQKQAQALWNNFAQKGNPALDAAKAKAGQTASGFGDMSTSVTKASQGVGTGIPKNIKPGLDWLGRTFGPGVQGLFTRDIPSWYAASSNGIESKFVQPVKTGFGNAWSWLNGTFGTNVDHFFVNDIPNWYSASSKGIESKFVQPVKTGLGNAWSWINGTFGTDVQHFFVNDIPNWWNSSAGFLNRNFVSPVQRALSGSWSWINGTFGTNVNHFFLNDLPNWWDSSTGFLNRNFIAPSQRALSGAWSWINGTFGTNVNHFFLNDMPNWWNSSTGFLNRNFIAPSQRALTGAWSWINGTFGTNVNHFFLNDMPNWWNSSTAFLNRNFLAPSQRGLTATWSWINGTFGTNVMHFFTGDLPSWWNESIGFLNRNFASPLQRALTGTWDWIKGVFGTDLTNFFTGDLPRMFANAVSGIARAWDNVENAFRKPIHIVAADVLAPLFKGIDAVTNFVGLGNPLAGAVTVLSRMASGGQVHGGTPGRDSVLAALMPGEVVVPTSMVKAGAVDHLRGRLPGFAAGGQVPPLNLAGYVNPIPRGVRPERIDQGVDFAGSGPILAIGGGSIIETGGGGWPGGPFMSYHLSSGMLAGSNVYVAENIHPTVKAGQFVRAGQVIANMFNGGTGIEMGFANAAGNSTLSQTPQAGSISGANLPGSGATAVGHLFDELLIGLGAPAAPNFNSPTGGKIPTGGGIPGKTGSGGNPFGGIINFFKSVGSGVVGVVKTLAQVFAKLGKFATIGVDLAKGDLSGAIAAFLGDFKPSNGGAKGELGTVLEDIPKTLIGDAAKHIMGAAKSFGAKQTAPSGGGASLGPGSGNYAADIQAVLKAMHLPLSLTSNWLTQIQTESGGNLSAVNRTDSNAAAGHPSVGLLQLIPATFHAFAGPYVNTPPLVNDGGGTVSLNPMAQIYAAIHYAASRYGGAAMAGVIGHGHGYAAGGVIPEPVVGWGMHSGSAYSFGENGPETIIPGVGRAGGGGVHVHFEVASSGNEFDQFMMTWMRHHVRVKGHGDVQTAFGRR